MRAVFSLALLVAACDRPQPFLICHNANCASAPDPDRDDTLEALDESLAAEYDGRPVFDGMEVDTVWSAPDDACVFAHDLTTSARVPATDAAERLAAWFAEPGPLAYSGDRFEVLLELKGYVDPEETQLHSEAQLAAHAACLWDLYTILSDAALAEGRDVEVVISSFEPPLLRAVQAQEPAPGGIPYRYAGVFGIPKPLDGQTHPLSDYAGTGIELVELHPQWLLDGQYDALRSSGLEVAFWMFSATSETLDAIDQYAPTYVTTSEAYLLRRWLAD